MNGRLWIAGLVVLIAGSGNAGGQQPAAQSGDARAAALMEAAGRTRYTWSPAITAVSGKFSWNQEGKSGAGSFRSVLHQREGMTFTPEGGAAVPDAVKEHIESMIMHRVPPPSGAGSGRQPAYVIVVEDDDRGPLIMTVGDPMHSTQRVKEGRLVQVNRAMEGKRFTIDVTRFEKSPDGRGYPADFTVTWWDQATGRRLERQSYTTEGLDLIEGQLFPKAERVVTRGEGKSATLRVGYSDVRFETGGGAGR
jgi:Protein of unknown function (DUF3386)